MNTLDQHLTDDQLETLLLGDAAEPDAAAHMAACTQCRAKQQAFLALVAEFNQASLDWASVRPPRAAGGERARPERRWFSTPAYAFATALLLLFALFFARSSGHFRNSTTQPRQTASSALQPNGFQPGGFQPGALQPPALPAAPRQDPQIADDNNLLAAIDLALDQPDPSLSLNSLSFGPQDPAEDETHSAAAR